MLFYCICLSTVHVSVVYFDYLCYLDTVTCSVVYTLTCVLCVVLLFILIACVTYIVCYSSTHDLLGLEATPGLPWLLLTQYCSLVAS